MSTNLPALNQAQVPAHLQNRGGATSGLVVAKPSFTRISLMGGKFTLVKGEEKQMLNTLELRVVIMAWSPKEGCGKTFYLSGYNADEQTPPDCSSDDGVTPNAGDTKQARTCAECPQNVWGTAIGADGNPTKGKACRDTKTLFVAQPDDISGELFQLRVPTTSLKALSAYATELQRFGNIPTNGVVTTIFFEPAEYPKIGFRYGGFLNEQQYAEAEARCETAEIQTLFGGAPELPAPEPEAPAIPEPPAHIAQATAEPQVATPAAQVQADPVVSNMPPAAVVPAETPVNTAPLQEPGAVVPTVDSQGLPWDERIHSSSQKVNQDGTWKKKRGVDATYFNQIVSELRGEPVAPPQETAPPATATAPSAPEAAPMAAPEMDPGLADIAKAWA